MTANPLHAIIDTFAQYDHPEATACANALFESVLEENVRCAREAYEASLKHYSHAATIMELDSAYAIVCQLDAQLDDARRMLQAYRTELPFPRYIGD